MTILGVFVTEQFSYLGADAGERYPDQRSGLLSSNYVPKCKVEQLGDRAVLWAYYGNGQRGDALARWLRENASSLADDWSESIHQIGDQWQEVSTRTEWEANSGVGVLIAGWLGGVQNCYFLPVGSTGMPLSLRIMGDPNPYFAGVGSVAATVGFNTAKALLPEADGAQLFEVAMDTTIRSVEDLWAANRTAREPLNLIRVSQDSIVTPIRGRIERYAGRDGANNG